MVVKPYNHDPNYNTNPGIDDPKDIVYTEGPACPGRIEVRIPAVAAPPAAIIPAAATYLSLATGPDQVRPVLPARVVSDVIINKD
ncbi:uncharacterized protein UV8b_04964 [Ustilaginoidea virens]|uniref:Uncharacterized protein n=1 Tax=Ustilaginoidea virens TaxID=1159556 RepID=A0A8E5HSV5_USTVR|nr:uncharacterized protein UV8b_04964 [Ustilaginoidea virens]QUC20723.1 hypothetical protein UV8b_04964 [Ustilaginoidea virens]